MFLLTQYFNDYRKKLHELFLESSSNPSPFAILGTVYPLWGGVVTSNGNPRQNDVKGEEAGEGVDGWGMAMPGCFA